MEKKSRSIGWGSPRVVPRNDACGTKRVRPGTFAVYDNLFYQGKPDTTSAGLVPSNILYESAIWPGKVGYGTLPSELRFAAIVRQNVVNPGPLVLDIEHLPLRGDPQTAQHNEETLATLADWARAAAPDKIVGFFGTGTLSKVDPADLSYAQELARHVDALFPPLYTTGPDQTNWKAHAVSAVAEAKSIAPGKPIFFYLWPQYVTGSKHEFEYLSSSYWLYQLQQSRQLANGVILWSPSRFSWDDSSGWWEATIQFMRSSSSSP